MTPSASAMTARVLIPQESARGWLLIYWRNGKWKCATLRSECTEFSSPLFASPTIRAFMLKLFSSQCCRVMHGPSSPQARDKLLCCISPESSTFLLMFTFNNIQCSIWSTHHTQKHSNYTELWDGICTNGWYCAAWTTCGVVRTHSVWVLNLTRAFRLVCKIANLPYIHPRQYEYVAILLYTNIIKDI